MLAGLALLLILVLARQPLSDWLWPETRLQQLREAAEQALREGRLSAPDGRGARELFEAALALDPDRGEARVGLTRVGRAALAQAEHALAARRYPEAHRMLQLARELALPRAETEAFAQRLRAREAAEAGIDRLLARAAAARRAGRLDGTADAALPLYQRVLELRPDQVQALEGREDTLADLLQQAQARLDRGDLDVAAAQIRRAQAADPAHIGLPDALAALAQAVERARRRADADLRRGRLAAAAGGYRAVLAAAADDPAAQRGLQRVAQAYAERSRRAAADFRFDEAEAALREARAVAVEAPGIAEAEQRLRRARAAAHRLDPRLPPAEADAAAARGDLLSPPGDSAFDKLRAAQALAPNDARVAAARARLRPAARACFERELRGNRLARAGACLDAWSALEGDAALLRAARQRLAQRWVAVGDERLGAGEIEAAQAALRAARALYPDEPGLPGLAARLRAAGAPER
ncbi:hypothetical protein EDC50_2886 [Vulcaniibacterium tengchongense]|uniref:Tetratricopeptide repeat protein n=1 Tax=Vulcaniibacterium tengchongense TaxID=1273429 RepID=A0A3N4V6W4_9GAMM|nr:hypothetical protein [Vulcaniibacterium tengchongense]RPE75441.1 hypothetical protein EDC50_2886 [Vulcaniibacterium tengchongense]